MRLTFFSFGIIEQGGGYENFVLNTSVGLKIAYPDLEIQIVTFDEKMTEKLQKMLSIYYVRKQPAESIYRESTTAIQTKLGQFVKYRKIKSFKDMKHVLEQSDILLTKNEILELGILAKYGFNQLPPVVTGIHTPVHYHFAPSPQAKLHNVLYWVFYKVWLRKLAAVYVQNATDYDWIKNRMAYKNVRQINQALDLKIKPQVINSSDKLRILFAGRLSEAKGVDILINCINTLDKNGNLDLVEVRIVGSGETTLENDVRELASKYSQVTYLGHVAHENMAKQYEWTDIALITSRYETLNKIAIEAGVHGKFAVVSDVPGPREIVINDRTGYLLPLEPEVFADKIVKISDQKRNNRSQFYKTGLNAQKHVAKLFNPEKAFKAMREMLAEVEALRSR